MTNPFTYNGYGRIYVQNQEDIQKVEYIISQLDKFEWSGYYPIGVVTTLEHYPNVIYIGKFQLNIDLKEECKKQNIPVFIFNSGFFHETKGYYPTEPLTKEQIQTLMMN